MIENETRIIGPPGCGKTTTLSRIVADKVQAFVDRTGSRADQCEEVLISSLTRAAATEVQTRGLEIGKHQIGTLHSHAMRALGNPKLCIDGESIDEWNKACSYGHTMTGGELQRANEDSWEQLSGKTHGDQLFSHYQLYRSRLTPRAEWRPEVADFAEEYERWKYVASRLDFTDLIHKAYEECSHAPGNPHHLLVDEAQDHDAAELRLIRKWASDCDSLTIVGDPDQNLYEWRGANPREFYASEIPPDNQRVLEQSYRVPAAVHGQAVKMIERAHDRVPVVYRPREFDGYVSLKPWSMRGSEDDVKRLVEAIEASIVARPDVEIMCLFTCTYMAIPLMMALKEAGIIFWNEYAKDRTDFNPYHPANGVSTAQRMMNFMRPSDEAYGDKARIWTMSEMASWVDICKVDGLLVRGAKKEISEMSGTYPDAMVKLTDLEKWFASPGVLNELRKLSLGWLRGYAMPKRVTMFDRVMKIIERRGYNAFQSRPNVTVGTIHSVKGGEADIVVLCPDLSSQGWKTFGNVHQRDSVFRMFYVGMTRAREKLVLTRPTDRMCIKW